MKENLIASPERIVGILLDIYVSLVILPVVTQTFHARSVPVTTIVFAHPARATPVDHTPHANDVVD